MLTTLEVGLCKGRHEIKNANGEVIDKYIFGHIENPLDFGTLEGMAVLKLNHSCLTVPRFTV